MMARFENRRNLFVQGLNEIEGVNCVMPRGAFYAFANVTEAARICGTDFKGLASMLLEEAGVACLDGTCFGQYGANFIRFSYANSEENLQKALERISDLIRKKRK